MHTKSYQRRLARNILLTLSTLSLGLFSLRRRLSPCRARGLTIILPLPPSARQTRR